MSARDLLDAPTRRRFQSGRVCLDFAHTGGVGRWVAAELISNGPTAARWLEVLLDFESGTVAATDSDVTPLRALREAVWQLCQAQIDGTRFAAGNVATVNDFATAAPTVPSLVDVGVASMRQPVAVAAVLSDLARDTIDLLGGPLRERVRRCAADDCELMFLDTSRPGQRRWCSMDWCGARSKMRRYRQSAHPQGSDRGE